MPEQPGQKTLAEWFAILGEIIALYKSSYKAAIDDGNISPVEYLDLGSKMIEILLRHNVRLEDIGLMLKSLGPLLSLFPAIARK